jgi:oligoribonuclease NrnB/cAMP/cGMP phosphodiesterase (DHH superfamily)
MLPYIIYHSPCSDGFASAFAAFRKFSYYAKYIPMNYNQSLPSLDDGAAIYMVDFSLKRSVLLDLAKNHKIVIIDHHASAQENLIDIEKESPNIECHFDMNHSGAVLSWNYFNSTQEMPKLFSYVEDRDLWSWKLPKSAEINDAINSYPMTFDQWFELVHMPMEYLEQEGTAIRRMTQHYVQALIVSPRVISINYILATPTYHSARYIVPAVNCPYFLASEVGHALIMKYPHAPFSATYRDETDGTQNWSFRSEDTRQNVKEIAVALGGGGHRNASGCYLQSHDAKLRFLSGEYK